MAIRKRSLMGTAHRAPPPETPRTGVAPVEAKPAGANRRPDLKILNAYTGT